MNVMVVDDEPLVRLSLRRALELRGHLVTECVNGKEARDLWFQVCPDLVYLDVLMPEMSGPEVLVSMRDQLSRSKVILMSAFTGEYDSKRARQLGADIFIPKPFDNIFEVIQTGEGLVSGTRIESK